MKPINAPRMFSASMSLADEIRNLIEQELFVGDEVTEQTMQIVTFALCLVLGEVIGSVAPDRKACRKAVRSMEPSILAFAEDMSDSMRAVRGESR